MKPLNTENLAPAFVLLSLYSLNKSLAAQFTPRSNWVCVRFSLDRIPVHSPFYAFHLAQGGGSKVAESESLISDEGIMEKATILKVAGGLRWERKPERGGKDHRTSS